MLLIKNFLKKTLNQKFDKDSNKKEQILIKKIHDEFDNKENEIFNSVNSLLKESNVSIESSIESEATRLIKLGFTSTSKVKEYESFLEDKMFRDLQRKKAEKLAKRILDYRVKYPNCKFLTTDALNDICKKYNLIYAPVNRYLRDVPEKNLKEIENILPLDEEDKQEVLFKLNGLKSLDLMHQLGKEEPIFTQQEIIDMMIKYWGRDVPDWTRSAIQSTWLYCIDEKINHIAEHKRYSYTSVSKIDRKELYICAPKIDFDLDGLQEDGLSFDEIQTIKLNDPIVFRYVKGGIQVISKWGLEASDEALLIGNEN